MTPQGPPTPPDPVLSRPDVVEEVQNPLYWFYAHLRRAMGAMDQFLCCRDDDVPGAVRALEYTLRAGTELLQEFMRVRSSASMLFPGGLPVSGARGRLAGDLRDAHIRAMYVKLVPIINSIDVNRPEHVEAVGLFLRSIRRQWSVIHALWWGNHPNPLDYIRSALKLRTRGTSTNEQVETLERLARFRVRLFSPVRHEALDRYAEEQGVDHEDLHADLIMIAVGTAIAESYEILQIRPGADWTTKGRIEMRPIDLPVGDYVRWIRQRAAYHVRKEVEDRYLDLSAAAGIRRRLVREGRESECTMEMLPIVDDAIVDAASPPPGRLAELNDALEALSTKLSEADMLALRMTLDGACREDIAQRLGTSTNAVNLRLSRLERRLAKRIR